MGPYIRTVLLIILILFAVRTGWWVSNSIYDLLSFQVVFYQTFLEIQSDISGSYAQLQQSITTAAQYIGRERGYTETGKNELLLEQRIDTFARKLRMIGYVCGLLTSLLVFKIGFDIIFGIKKYWNRIVTFIIE